MGVNALLHIELCTEDQTMLALLRAVLTLAGHTVSIGMKKEPSLKEFLEALVAQLVLSTSPPYDLLIIDVSNAEMVEDREFIAYLERLILLDLLPVILLTDVSHYKLTQAKERVPTVPFLFRRPLLLQDLFRAIELTTKAPPPISSAFLLHVQRQQREQYDHLLHMEQVRVEQRQTWLNQRQVWIEQRQTWLNQRQVWIEEKRRDPNPQREWLDEQQTWVEQQRRDADQQQVWLGHLRQWLHQYRRRIDQDRQEPFRQAQ